MIDQAAIDRVSDRLRSERIWVSHDGRIDEPAAAALIGVRPRTLREWRGLGTGPSFVFAGKVTYYIAEILAFLASKSNRAA